MKDNSAWLLSLDEYVQAAVKTLGEYYEIVAILLDQLESLGIPVDPAVAPHVVDAGKYLHTMLAAKEMASASI